MSAAKLCLAILQYGFVVVGVALCLSQTAQQEMIAQEKGATTPAAQCCTPATVAPPTPPAFSSGSCKIKSIVGQTNPQCDGVDGTANPNLCTGATGRSVRTNGACGAAPQGSSPGPCLNGNTDLTTTNGQFGCNATDILLPTGTGTCCKWTSFAGAGAAPITAQFPTCTGTNCNP